MRTDNAAWLTPQVGRGKEKAIILTGLISPVEPLT